MISDEPMRLIRMRPHHIGIFAEYYVHGRFMQEHDYEARRYGKKFIAQMRRLYDDIIFDEDSVSIMIVDGSRGDKVCDSCTVKACHTRNTSDDLNIWNGSGLTMELSGLEIGRLYTAKEFRARVRRLYPNHTD